MKRFNRKQKYEEENKQMIQKLAEAESIKSTI